MAESRQEEVLESTELRNGFSPAKVGVDCSCVLELPSGYRLLARGKGSGPLLWSEFLFKLNLVLPQYAKEMA